MEEKKYELLKDDTIMVDGRTLYCIRALKDFYTVKKGNLGGYVEKEDNLSQKGNCWISGNARVYDNARVSGNALVFDDAEILGNAQVFDNAYVFGNACISGNARVYDNARVLGNACISGNARVYDNAWVSGNTRISANANISSIFDYCVISGFGSECRTTTFFKCKDDTIKVNCGCFNGTLEEFRKKVKETHKDTKYAEGYLKLADLMEWQLNNN